MPRKQRNRRYIPLAVHEARSQHVVPAVENQNTMPGQPTMSSNAVMPGNTTIAGNAVVSGNAVMPGNLTMAGNAVVSGNSTMPGTAVKPANPTMSGNAVVPGNTINSGNAVKPVNPVISNLITQARTWKSTHFEERENYFRMKNLGDHFAPQSPFLPQSFIDWVDYRYKVKTSQTAELKRKIGYKVAQKEIPAHAKVGKLFTVNKVLDDRLSPVLALPSVWCIRDGQPVREHAPWPSQDEFRHEGQARVYLGQVRFFPIPRHMDDPAKWKRSELLLPVSDLDEVGPMDQDGDLRRIPKPLTEMQEMNAMEDEELEFWEPVINSVKSFLDEVDDEMI